MEPQQIAEILEVIMVVSFGISWPFNVYKSFKTKSTKGKSLLFILLIEFGYTAGIIGKIIVWNSDKWWVFMFYVINFVMVGLDLILYFINRRREKLELQVK